MGDRTRASPGPFDRRAQVTQPEHRQVVVIGGGFAGVYAAKGLARHGVEVALIDTNGFQTFQPMLYQAATGMVSIDDITYPLNELHRVEAIHDTVTGVDVAGHKIELASGRTLTADFIVLATGAKVNFFGVPGAAEHAFPLYTADDARRIGARGRQLVESSTGYTVVVVGAGATGVEISGAIIDSTMDLLPRTFPDFHSESVHVHIVDRGAAPLAHMSTESQRYAHDVLSKAGVTFHFGRGVTEVAASQVTLDDGTSLTSDLTIWAGGLSVRLPELTPMPDVDSHGRVVIADDLRVPGQPRLYCVGDASGDHRNPLPQLGSVAKQQGIAVAHAIRRQLKGKDPHLFTYRDLGDMAMVRHGAATVEVGASHHTVDGPAAFAMWLGLHAYLLPGDDHRVEAVRAWGYELTTGKSKYLLK